MNLIMGREVVRELIQRDMSAGKAAVQLREILHGGAGRERMLEEFADLRRIVGPAGASRRFAAKMVSFLKLRIEN